LSRIEVMPVSDPQRKANRRLGLVLASVALVFFLGFMTKMVLLGR
jgi:hypothetical protein